jgi:hypothetical protein
LQNLVEGTCAVLLVPDERALRGGSFDLSLFPAVRHDHAAVVARVDRKAGYAWGQVHGAGLFGPAKHRRIPAVGNEAPHHDAPVVAEGGLAPPGGRRDLDQTARLRVPEVGAAHAACDHTAVDADRLGPGA